MAINVNVANMTINEFLNIFHKEKFPEGSQSLVSRLMLVAGKAGGAGVSAEGKVTTGGVSGKIGTGLGLGAGVEISIAWSNFSLW